MLWLLLEESGELLVVVEAVEEINVELYRLAIVERYGQNAVLFVVGEVRNLGDGEGLFFDTTLSDCRIDYLVVIYGNGTAFCRQSSGIADLTIGRIEHVWSGDNHQDGRRRSQVDLQPAIIVPLAVQDSLAGVFEKFVETFPEKFGLILLDLDGIDSHPFIQLRQTAEIFP